MDLKCPALLAGALIPNRFALEGVPGGRNISLPLRWSGAPSGTRSYVLSIVDKHPAANNWLHWCVVNLPAELNQLDEGVSSGGQLPRGCFEFRNSFGREGYGGPKPPRGSGPHHYVITLYALSSETLLVSDQTSLSELLNTIRPLTLASASTTGIFEQ